MNLGQIVQHCHQLPLTVDLLFTAQSESFDPYGIIDMTEDWFDNPGLQGTVYIAPVNKKIILL